MQRPCKGPLGCVESPLLGLMAFGRGRRLCSARRSWLQNLWLRLQTELRYCICCTVSRSPGECLFALSYPCLKADTRPIRCGQLSELALSCRALRRCLSMLRVGDHKAVKKKWSEVAPEGSGNVAVDLIFEMVSFVESHRRVSATN